MAKGTDLKIGLALGSGAARGWAHIGVLRALEEIGIEPDIICGTSIGAAVGAAYLTDQLDELQAWAQKMGWLGMLGIIDLTFRRGGLVAAEKAFGRFDNERSNVRIEDLRRPFATVATDLSTGREIWLRDGPLMSAVMASAAMPGLFPAVRRDHHLLVDGALVNPVPVSLCRALGADIVVAVNLNSELSPLGRPGGRNGKGAGGKGAGGKGTATKVMPPEPVVAGGDAGSPALSQLTSQISTWLGRKPSRRTRFLADQIDDTQTHARAHRQMPNALEVMAGSIDIMQDRITRSRLAGEPPDVLIAPRLAHIGILEFDRAAEAVEIGHAAAAMLRPSIEFALRSA